MIIIIKKIYLNYYINKKLLKNIRQIDKKFKKIMRLMNYKTIELFGVPGVGKTTFEIEIKRYLKLKTK